MPISTTFRDPGPLVDGDLSLALVERFPGDPARDWVPAYRFRMRVAGADAGSIELRLGTNHFMEHFGGHVAYEVAPAHRGHHFAARSLRLLLPLAWQHGFETLWITCNPDNVASRRTCERAGGHLIEIVDLPADCDMYAEGERQKCRYCFVP